jgi:hypothetical protein
VRLEPALAQRAESCWTELSRAQYQALAGLRPHADLQSIHRRWAPLFDDAALAELRAGAGSGDAGAARRSRHLLEFLVTTRAELATATLLDERWGWESTRLLPFGDRPVGVRQAPRVLADTADRSARWTLEDARLAALAEVEPLDRRRLEEEWAVYGAATGRDYVGAWESLSGIAVAPVLDAARSLLAATADAYRDRLAAALRRQLGLEPGAVRAVDRLRLERAVHLDAHLAGAEPLALARRQLGELGMPLDGGRVRLDLEARPAKWSRAFCAVIRVPDEIVLVVTPAGGWRDWYAFFHELGHALHLSHVDAALPFEDRALGDISLSEAFARLFEVAAGQPSWLRRYLGLGQRAAAAFADTAALLDLVRMRRQAAKLIYELELHRGGFDGMPARYAEIMTDATGFRHDPASYLDDLDPHLYCVRYLRSWALEAMLAEMLRDRFDEDWFRNPRAGPYLLELFAAGQSAGVAAVDWSPLKRSLAAGQAA